MTYSEIILYARFSSREQAEGMSIARQIGEASEWCRANGHTPTRQILDEGRSGFHGHHRSVGALGEFEAEAAAGLHRGALLVVERIDRLTREGHSAIMSLINGLTANGVSVFTVKNNRLYRAGEEMSLVDAITTLVEGDLGHTESATKASRTASNWRIRRERAAEAGKAMSATVCPPWLKVVDGKYELDHDKVAILNQIFQMSDDGLGASVIVRELNKVGKPTGWSNRKRKDISTRWQRCEIVQLLANRAVIGERQDKRRINKQIELLEPVRGFYPVAIDPALFDRVRDAASVRKKVRGGAKSPKIANLVEWSCHMRALWREDRSFALATFIASLPWKATIRNAATGLAFDIAARAVKGWKRLSWTPCFTSRWMIGPSLTMPKPAWCCAKSVR
jgi:DNA invertase Pin-like site-specific DNA recombinase